jgi:Protein of unknown function (DUF3619)
MSAFPALSATEREALEGRVGLRLAALLEESSQHVGHDISERLRVSRGLALERARAQRTRAVTASSVVTQGGTAALGGPEMRWGWRLLLGALPVLALVAGLVAVDQWQADEQIYATAELDAGLLSDTLPPEAYRDPGFAEFVKESFSTMSSPGIPKE